METFSLTCENCGAPLTVAKSARKTTCNHCGTRVGIKPASRDPSVVILDSPRPAKPPIQTRPPWAGQVEKPYDPAHRWRREENEQVRVVRHGANLLAAIGTARSLPHLIGIDANEPTSPQAQAAILDIRNAGRQPVDATP